MKKLTQIQKLKQSNIVLVKTIEEMKSEIEYAFGRALSRERERDNLQAQINVLKDHLKFVQLIALNLSRTTNERFNNQNYEVDNGGNIFKK